MPTRLRFKDKHYKGIETLIKYFVRKRTAMIKEGNDGKAEDCFRNVTKLSRLRKEQFYNLHEQDYLNTCRDHYILDIPQKRKI
tara:strand:- start:168 stop:416 length:249 start_codon:yes stop_codon:yes gene_type:complete